MKYLINYLEVPLDYQLEKWENSKLKDNMFLTAEPLYQTKEIEFTELHNLIKSDYRQYTPFEFMGGKKRSENWSNENQNLLILDVDDGLTIAEAKDMFKEYKYLIATTKSHQVEKKGLKCDRFRVIIPSLNIPRGSEYFEFTKILENKYPFIDTQVNTKTGAFLGSADCEYWYNNGKDFNCRELIDIQRKIDKATFKQTQANTSKAKQKVSKPQATYSNEIDTQAIKSRLTRETVADIVSSCGFEVNRKFMFKYRPDERTPSASISPDLLIKDFGSDLSTDSIGFVQETKQMNFKDACEYVGSYVGITHIQNDNINMAVL